MGIAREPFGTLPDGTAIERWRLQNAHGLQLEFLSHGGILSALRVPDRQGRAANILLGLPRLEDYVARSPYFGGLIGRCANRIARARFSLDGAEHALFANDGPNSLHGGKAGFDKRVWSAAEV